MIINKIKNIALICVFCSFFTSLQSADAATVTTSLSGKVVSQVTRATALPFEAVVEEVLVKPGQSVMKDQVLMKYTLTDDARRNLQQEVTTGANTEEDRANILSTERQLVELTNNRNTARKLSSSGLGPDQLSDRLAGDVDSIRQRIKLLKRAVAKREKNFKQRLEELSEYFGVTIKEGMDLPKSLVLKAPMDGRVLSLASGLFPNKELAEGAKPITIGTLNPMLINVLVYEGDMEDIKVGDIGQATIPSLNDKVIDATVSNISWTSNNIEIGAPSYFTIEFTIPNPDFELRPGFKVLVAMSRNVKNANKQENKDDAKAEPAQAPSDDNQNPQGESNAQPIVQPSAQPNAS